MVIISKSCYIICHENPDVGLCEIKDIRYAVKMDFASSAILASTSPPKLALLNENPSELPFVSNWIIAASTNT